MSRTSNRNGKWWLSDSPRKPKHKLVPEGGSAAVYLLGVGLTCFGAMFLRSRIAKPTQY